MNVCVIWDNKLVLGNGFDEGKEVFNCVLVCMEEGVSNGDFEIIKFGFRVVCMVVIEFIVVKCDFNVEFKKGVGSLIFVVCMFIELVEVKVGEVEVKKVEVG